MPPVPAGELEPVRTAYGLVEGVSSQPPGVRVFRGIPYAAPPVGGYRWKAPRAPKKWRGIRRADQFGPRCMQEPLFADMVFRSNRTSEDCLYLNIWTPSAHRAGGYPVLVYYHGGGLVAGDGSEPRYDGESLARRGIVVVTLNYRLGVFGFLAHPELSRETSYGGSGNYGLLDQAAGLRWVQENIAAFGGDPHHVTIGGESAGSVSVSALMASPLSRKLIAGAIGESGSILGTLSAVSLTAAEANGHAFAAQAGAASVADLRAMRATTLLALATKFGALRFDPPSVRFTPCIDGYFLPKAPAEIYAAGEQAHVPLLAGSNSEELPPSAVLGDATPTVANYRSALEKLYALHAEAVFSAYPATAPGEDVLEAAQTLASDRFTGYSTRKWIDLATETGDKRAFYYLFSRIRPAPEPVQRRTSSDPAGTQPGGAVDSVSPEAVARGALHAGEIEYVLGNLDRSPMYPWTSEDRQVSQAAQSYWVRFVASGNPNTPGLPEWPSYVSGQRLILDVVPRVEPDVAGPRMRLFDELMAGGAEP